MEFKSKDKQLLLQDLCGRLPYGVKVSYYGSSEECECVDVVEGIYSNGEVVVGQYGLPAESVKPYLFPLSSMTEEQRKEWHSTMFQDEFGLLTPLPKSFDWLNAHRFDYRGLIEESLALDATNLNIY